MTMELGDLDSGPDFDCVPDSGPDPGPDNADGRGYVDDSDLDGDTAIGGVGGADSGCGIDDGADAAAGNGPDQDTVFDGVNDNDQPRKEIPCLPILK